MPAKELPPDLPDYSTKAGAKLLMATIRNYWKFRGYNISIEIVEVTSAPRHFGIRSNLVNGIPPRSAMRMAA